MEHELHPYFWRIMQDAGFEIGKITNIEKEHESDAIESTGVLIIDRKFKRAYVNLSQRATPN